MPRMVGKRAKILSIDHVEDLLVFAPQTPPSHSLEEPDVSPPELAVNFTDGKRSFVSEASVYRRLKDHGLITSPAFIGRVRDGYPRLG
jgi:tRNA splicing endonuclease